MRTPWWLSIHTYISLYIYYTLYIISWLLPLHCVRPRVEKGKGNFERLSIPPWIRGASLSLCLCLCLAPPKPR